MKKGRIIIEYEGHQAIYKSKKGKWFSSEKCFEDILNQNLPNFEEYGPDLPLRIGGIEKVVLDAVKKIYGSLLNVIVFEPSPLPPEKNGVVI